jgi:hypothetical protein
MMVVIHFSTEAGEVFDLTLGNVARYFNGRMAVNLPPPITPPNSITTQFEETHVDRIA